FSQTLMRARFLRRRTSWGQSLPPLHPKRPRINPDESRNVKTTLAFDPNDLGYPRSTEWEPQEYIVQYLVIRVCKPPSWEGHNKLRAKCPRTIFPDMVAKTPE
ncbi:Hypothetical predicted protein, partial [Pelobates cultripes]